MYQSVEERRAVAEREFFDLADLASSAGVLGFMGPAFREAVQDTINASETLQGVIISGPAGEFAFEQAAARGATVSWVGDSPRFNRRFAVSSEPLFTPLRIEGLRNVTISAVFLFIDYDFFIVTLKQTLLMILAALTVALFTLILESVFGKKPVPVKVEPAETEGEPVEAETPGKSAGTSWDFEAPFEEGGISPEPVPAFEPEAPEPVPEPEAPFSRAPQGLYSPRSGLGWEAYTLERLAAELHRCASFEQDLVILVMEYRPSGLSGGALEGVYNQLADLVSSFFNLRDLIFERGEKGIVVIIPNIDLDQGLVKSENFRSRIPVSVTTLADLCIGVSSRAGRLVNAERLLFEASEALKRAKKDPLSPIVAFKSDPEKYRAFIQKKKTAL
ncbi:MAG: hypothetical protein LBQ38_05880 [Spirochaetaceae bacterium]|nr:hypothetical protein [Spirochaetaceae bacterium]